MAMTITEKAHLLQIGWAFLIKKAMGKEVKQNIDKLMIDAIIERPITFTLGKEYFYLYPPSIGITLMCSDIIKRLKFDKNLLAVSEQFELLRICTDHRDDVLRMVAFHTLEHRADARIEEKVLARMEEMKTLDAAELLTLFVAVMQWNTYQDKFVKHIGLDKEKKQRERIQEIKKDKSYITFGGRSLYGTLLDFAAERYGYTVDYILWGVSATNLHMMMNDSVQSIYLTDKERKKAMLSTDGVIINADDKNSKAALTAYLKNRKRKQ